MVSEQIEKESDVEKTASVVATTVMICLSSRCCSGSGVVVAVVSNFKLVLLCSEFETLSSPEHLKKIKLT